MSDFTLSLNGSIAILTPLSQAAVDHCDVILPADALHYAGGYVIECRYLADICNNLQADAFTIERS